MSLKKSSLIVLSLTINCLMSTSTYANKSVFIISDHSSSHAQAFAVEANEVEYQADIDISTLNPGNGAVANAVWPDKELMFVTMAIT